MKYEFPLSKTYLHRKVNVCASSADMFLIMSNVLNEHDFGFTISFANT